MAGWVQIPVWLTGAVDDSGRVAVYSLLGTLVMTVGGVSIALINRRPPGAPSRREMRVDRRLRDIERELFGEDPDRPVELRPAVGERARRRRRR